MIRNILVSGTHRDERRTSYQLRSMHRGARNPVQSEPTQLRERRCDGDDKSLTPGKKNQNDVLWHNSAIAQHSTHKGFVFSSPQLLIASSRRADRVWKDEMIDGRREFASWRSNRSSWEHRPRSFERASVVGTLDAVKPPSAAAVHTASVFVWRP